MKSIKVLDHGYVTLVETWGSDERIIEAARMSTNKGFQGWGPIHEGHCVSRHVPASPTDARSNLTCNCTPKHGDERLLRFLYENKHFTPFEMAGMIIEVQAPIFVFREWHRHRTQSYNELSARYTPMPDVNYVPTVERLLMTGGTNKQAQGTGAALTGASARKFQEKLIEQYAESQRLYMQALDSGVPKELARCNIPVGRYSRMRASANLRNWLQFLTLRQDDAAQWEIRQYANAVADLVQANFPRTYNLYVSGRGKPCQ